MAWMLAHPAGFLLFNVFTVVWFAVPFVIAHVLHASSTSLVFVLASYLDVVTWFGGATQFTLAYQNRLMQMAEERRLEHDAVMQRNQLDLMTLMVELARKIREGQDEMLDDIGHIQEDLDAGAHG